MQPRVPGPVGSLATCTATLADHEESFEAFSFSLAFFFIIVILCSRPVVSPYGIVANVCASAPSPSSSPSTCVDIQNSASAWRQSHASKDSHQGPGPLVRDSTGRVPCLVQRFLRPPPSHNMLPSQSISTPPQLPSTCCVIVATPDGGLGTWTGQSVSVKNGERGISRRPAIRQAALANAAPTCTVGQCPARHCAHARTQHPSTHALAHQTMLDPPVPLPTATGIILCTKKSVRL